MSDPLVSILVPTYNGERFLRTALDSALAQTHRSIEVVVGDDASTDGTPQILADVAAADPRVRVIRHESNRGAWDNSRLLLEEARGEYVKYLLHDDVLEPECVSRLLEGLTAVPGATLAFSRRVLVDPHGKPLPGHEFPALSEQPGVIDGRALGNAVLEACHNAIGELTTVLFRRADVDPGSFLHIDGRRLQTIGDLAEFLKLLARGPAFYTPAVLSHFRQHAGQNSQDQGLVGGSACDWPRLIDWSARNGFLADPLQRQRAHVRALQNGAHAVGATLGTANLGRALEAVHLSLAALAEPAAGQPVDLPLQVRAHTRPFLDLLPQELDVWTRSLPVALAAPAVESAEISATVQAFREVRATAVAETLFLAVPEGAVDQAVPLIERSLAEGEDVDVQLVPTDDPAGLFPDHWLAVAPRGAGWHGGRASAVWTFELPTSSGAEATAATVTAHSAGATHVRE